MAKVYGKMVYGSFRFMVKNERLHTLSVSHSLLESNAHKTLKEQGQQKSELFSNNSDIKSELLSKASKARSVPAHFWVQK